MRVFSGFSWRRAFWLSALLLAAASGVAQDLSDVAAKRTLAKGTKVEAPGISIEVTGAKDEREPVYRPERVGASDRRPEWCAPAPRYGYVTQYGYGGGGRYGASHFRGGHGKSFPRETFRHRNQHGPRPFKSSRRG